MLILYAGLGLFDFHGRYVTQKHGLVMRSLLTFIDCVKLLLTYPHFQHFIQCYQ